MKALKTSQKALYISVCIMLATFLFGCKEKGGKITVFENLPESHYLTEIKTSLENNKPLIVAFLAEWCPHCRKYKPVFLEVKKEYEDKVTFINIDVDDPEGTAISSRFQVKGIPTTAFVRTDGSIFKVQVGGIENEDLKIIVEDLLKSRRKKRGEPIAPFPIEPQEVKAPKEEQPPPQELIKKEETEEPVVEPKEEPTPELVPEVSPQPPSGEEAAPEKPTGERPPEAESTEPANEAKGSGQEERATSPDVEETP